MQTLVPPANCAEVSEPCNRASSPCGRGPRLGGSRVFFLFLAGVNQLFGTVLEKKEIKKTMMNHGIMTGGYRSVVNKQTRKNERINNEKKIYRSDCGNYGLWGGSKNEQIIMQNFFIELKF
ncbi:hypothetical protein CDAR_78881 [Caerostris darwini]|uniref:Uncharacterized protein n=1 Tax=Caerostris darwini TaxID=1538125 RepID=A0AAV4Q3W4_9ARAC|nr:hypothetical protein CDAR_78881 [Caerostris darwini]